MSQLIKELIESPLKAFTSSVEILSEGFAGSQTIDGVLSRIIHNLSCPPSRKPEGEAVPGKNSSKTRQEVRVERDLEQQPMMTNTQIRVPPPGSQGHETLTTQDHAVLERVEQARKDGVALKSWWERTYPDGFAQKFDLERVFNRPADSFGFFDQVQLETGLLPVMGNFQSMFYDRPRTPANLNQQAAQWMCEQIQEFVLHYFMRVSSFRQPEVYVDSGQTAPPSYLEGLSWCRQADILREGFGFTQCYYKLSDSGEVGKFTEAEQTAIVDLREIGPRYEWIVVRVRIFDFAFRFKPIGSTGPELSVPLSEESYLVLSRDFISNEINPSSACLGRFGLGYAFIRDPHEGVIGYGPGQFKAAIEIINFEVSKHGEVYVSMIFVANRPERIANVSLNPVDWTFRLGDLFSLGTTSKLFAPVKDALQKIPPSGARFDPVYGFVSLVNALTGNQAARQFCISREQLEKNFLAQHFIQHYATIVGSLLTWRQIPDWLDSRAVPEWARAGKSS